MCLIAVGWQAHPDFPLLLAANRDEFYARPTTLAGRWTDVPEIIGGRDLEAGGSWLACSANGRFAAVTNVREPGQAPGRLSRGALVADFLRGTLSAQRYAEAIDDQAYAGFNLLLGDSDTLIYRTNRHGSMEILPPGIYGLSNHRLDTPWPKLLSARHALAAALPALPDKTALFTMLSDASTVDDARLPNTGVALDWERRLSAIFIASENYGTRASTVLMRDRDGRLQFEERSFGPFGQPVQVSLIDTGV